MNSSEFNGERAKRYAQSLTKYPEARIDDITAMHRLLAPQRGERILGIGEGNGYFCNAIATAVGPNGHYLITDPSSDQLANLHSSGFPQVEVRCIGAEALDLPSATYDKVWSFGAFHHCPDQTIALRNIYRALKPGGKLVLCDVFQGTALAQHFDTVVARHCVTGHEVKFLSQEFARTLCALAGFQDKDVAIVGLSQRWRFPSAYACGEFVYDLHALRMPGTKKRQIESTLESCERILGVERIGLHEYILQWPMKSLIARR